MYVLLFAGSATLRAIGVEFTDLWKIRAPVGNCEGFDLGHFDRMIEVHVGLATYCALIK